MERVAAGPARGRGNYLVAPPYAPQRTHAVAFPAGGTRALRGGACFAGRSAALLSRSLAGRSPRESF